MPVDKPARTCREAFDCPRVHHAARTPVLNYPGAQFPLETSDRDLALKCTDVGLQPGRRSLYCWRALVRIFAHLLQVPACHCVCPHEDQVMTMSGSDTWQRCLIWILLSARRHILLLLCSSDSRSIIECLPHTDCMQISGCFKRSLRGQSRKGPM